METKIEAYSPAEIAVRVQTAGVNKAALSTRKTLLLGFLGGAFIALGAMLYLMVMSDPQLGWGLSRFIGGIAFSLGLVLILVGGAELFTGNMLIVMAAAGGAVPLSRLLRNWSLVFVGNAAGAASLALMFYFSGLLDANVDPPAKVLATVVGAKNALSVSEAFIRGVLCNILVCLAVWLTMSCRLTISKIFAIAFPIAAFVALGLEHSIANLFFYPAQMLMNGEADSMAMLRNLLPVTLGNVFGGGVCVAGVYRVIYSPVMDSTDSVRD